MLSEGSAVLLSRHGASLASKPESFGFGRTFTDMTACPLPGHADDPAFWQNNEAFHLIGSFDDFGFERGQDRGQRRVKNRSFVSAVGEKFFEEREHAEQGCQQHDAAIAILNARGCDDAVQKQALHVDENMPLLALDQLARIKAVRIDAGPPFSALLTLWLSMMAAVGLASRSSFSRHATYSV